MPDGSSRRSKVAVDIRIATAGWRAALPEAAALLRRAVRAALKAELPAQAETGLSILLTDDAEMRKLNAGWRAKDKPTNVLSFPDETPGTLGDVALAYETCAAEARAQGKTLGAHLAHLVVHGTLHLLGWDHETVPEALAMEARERRVLRRLRIADPYRVHQVKE